MLNPSLPRNLTGVHIVLAEDDDDARELLTLVLESCGASVAAGASAQEALRLSATRPPQALVSDLAMPDEDGYWLLRELRHRWMDLPAVAVTAFGREHARDRALAAGFNAYLRKPFDPHELCDTLATLTTRP
jgi:CheY-like chemotaxis protein